MRALPLVLALVAACGGTKAPDPIIAAEQRTGDAEVGYAALVNEGYVGCGVPYEAYVVGFPPARADELIPGRTGRNQELPFNFTSFVTDTGVEVVTPNCLQCHAEYLEGELIIGLGNHTADYTFDVGPSVILSGAVVDDGVNTTEWEKWKTRMLAVAPYTQTRTVGVNPADNLAAALFAHRDPQTLAWSDEPILELPPPIVAPVDPPPWWHMSRKNAMFYTAAGRGDHARIMMTASTLCIDTVDQAQAIDDYFPDVRSYLLSIEPPPYSGSIDAELAAQGELLYQEECSDCHGSYGSAPSYPNLLIDAGQIGTDPLMALGASQFADIYVDWFNESFYGELSQLDPQEGYVAPPLDGIWASAPYFHNGSVPNLEQVLDSSKRPTYFRRSYDTSNYDHDKLGWPFEALATGQSEPPEGVPAYLIYDTTQAGYSNAGHTYGDDFSDAERRAVLEYLKTL